MMITEATNPDEKNVAEELAHAKASNVEHAAKNRKSGSGEVRNSGPVTTDSHMEKGPPKTPLKEAKIVEGDLMPAPTSTTADVPFINITADSSFEAIREAGVRHQQRTVEHILLFGKCVAALASKCPGKKGGTEFTKKAEEYWNLNKDAASQYRAIGNHPSLETISKVLPPSYSAIASIAKLPDDDIEGFVESEDIHPGVTTKEVKALGKSKVDKNTQQAASEDAGDSEAVDAHDEKNARDQAPAAAAGEDKSEINASPKANRAVSTTLDAAYEMVDGLAGEQDMIAVVCYIAEKVTPARLIEALQELGE